MGVFFMFEVPLYRNSWIGRGPSPSKARPYRGTSLRRNKPPVGPYSRPTPRVLWWSWGGALFLMSESPLYTPATRSRTVKNTLDPYGFFQNLVVTF